MYINGIFTSTENFSTKINKNVIITQCVIYSVEEICLNAWKNLVLKIPDTLLSHSAIDITSVITSTVTAKSNSPNISVFNSEIMLPLLNHHTIRDAIRITDVYFIYFSISFIVNNS